MANNSNTRNRRNTRNTSNKSNNYRKGNGRSNSKFDRDDEEEEGVNNGPRGKRKYPGKKGNDPQWYATDPSLLRDAASIPFSWAVGTPIDLSNPLLQTLVNKGQFTVPGICVLQTMPSVGRSIDASSPINVAATSVYSFVRHANSGHANYDSPDLMIYLMSMTQIYSYVNMLQRAYGIATLYSQRNRYMPAALLRANYIDFDDVQNNLANFRYGINVLINKIASLAVPNTMTIFTRQAFMYQNLYCEGESVKDQMYMFVPDSFYKYTLGQDGAGSLTLEKFYKVGAPMYTVKQLLDFGNKLLMPILQSEDMNIMSGDILKAYQGNIIKVQSLPEFYPIVPVPNIGILEQFKNATVVSNIQGNNVVQSPNKDFLKCEPTANSVYNAADTPSAATAERRRPQVLMEARLLTTTLIESTPEMVIENTRLMCGGLNYNDDVPNIGYTDVICGSEIVTAARIYTHRVMADGSIDMYIDTYEYAKMYNTEGDQNYQSTFMRFMTRLSNFKFHPACHVISFKEGTSPGSINIADSNILFDMDNYAVLTVQDLSKMHESALLNMLNVPSIAKIR